MDDEIRKLERLARSGDAEAIARLHRAKERLRVPDPGPSKKERQEERRLQNIKETERRRQERKQQTPAPVANIDNPKSFLKRVLSPEEYQSFRERKCGQCGRRLMPVSRRCIFCEKRKFS